MNWTISYLAEENTIYSKTSGDISFQSVDLMIKDLVEAKERYKSASLLIDHREIEGRLNTIEIYHSPNILDRFQAPRATKVAILTSRSHLKDISFLGTVLRNRGYQASIFLDLEEAKAWITE